MGRVVVEHPDGRRNQVDEDRFDDPVANTHNFGGEILLFPRGGGWVTEEDPGRPQADHVSYRDEGFVIVADIADHDYTAEDGTVVLRGHEVPRDPELYRGPSLCPNFNKESKPTAKGREAAEEYSSRPAIVKWDLHSASRPSTVRRVLKEGLQAVRRTARGSQLAAVDADLEHIAKMEESK